MFDAGHILGSAMLEIVDRQPSSSITKIVFSGDLGNSPEPLLQPTEVLKTAGAVVMESTYGDRLHPDLDPQTIVQSEINSIEKSGGTLLIPAFSLERTQELQHMIMHLKKAGRIANQTPIFLDSPMAQNATRIYLKYPQLFNDHLQSELANNNPFEFPGIVNVDKPAVSQAIGGQVGPKVIIAGSGMMTGGRIVGHAARYLPDSSTRVLIVGYQGEETLGREILEGQKKVVIDGVTINVKATITSNQGMSSHADQAQLLGWLKNITGIEKVCLTHGEDPARQVLATKITEELGLSNISQPHLNQEISL
jgi:metallo-beta-lactamase family protein